MSLVVTSGLRHGAMGTMDYQLAASAQSGAQETYARLLDDNDSVVVAYVALQH